MKQMYCVAAVLILAVASLCLVLTQSAPSGNIWAGYKILFVAASFPEKNVLALCEKWGINDVVALSKQKSPIMSPISPVQPKTTADSYLVRRNALFFDQSGKYALFYVPDRHADKLRQLASNLTDSLGVAAGIDAPEKFPLIVPVVCFAVLLFFIAIAQNPILIIAGGLFPFLLTLRLPLYPLAASVCFVFYSFYLLQKIWFRRNFIRAWYRRGCPLFIVVGVAFAALYSVRIACAFILMLAASASLLYVLGVITTAREAKSAFAPVRIRPASVISIMTPKSIVLLIPSALACGVWIAFSVLGFSRSFSENDLYLPSPARYTVTKGFTVKALQDLESIRDANSLRELEKDSNMLLPDLGNFIRWSWATLVFPYRSLNRPIERPIERMPHERESGQDTRNDTEAGFPVFTQNESGISSAMSQAYVFDDSFIADVLKAVDNAPFSAFEQVLKAQERFVTVTYAHGSVRRYVSRRTFALLIAVMAALPLSFGIFCFINTKAFA